MASTSMHPESPSKLTDLLTCPVCLDTFDDPKTLLCLHSFCSKCLENCRHPYRRDITCPVCKRVTALSTMGVQGLQNDFRIQQIRDIVNSSVSQARNDDELMPEDGDQPTHACSLCQTEHTSTSATWHCIQCSLYFCGGCMKGKHDANPLFAGHHSVSIAEKDVCDVVFCKLHVDQSMRYFCQQCSVMLCTICTMQHDTSHRPEPLENGVVQKYQDQLQSMLDSTSSRLADIKNKTKYLETIKESHQKAFYEARTAIKERASKLVRRIREQEKSLQQEVQTQIEAKMKDSQVDLLADLKFHSANVEALNAEVLAVIRGSPHMCLLAHDDLVARMKAVHDFSLPAIAKSKAKSGISVRFVHGEDSVDMLLGSIQECSITEQQNAEHVTTSSFSASSCSKQPPVQRRASSILNALSPTGKGDLKLSKVKVIGKHPERSSPNSTINVDELIGSTSNETEEPTPAYPASPSYPASPAYPASPTAGSPSSACLELSPGRVDHRPRLLLKLDQIGGWPGKIMPPSSVAFLQDGNIVVAECENRLQIFNQSGQSVKIIGWGKVKPESVTVSREGHIAITDKQERCVKVFGIDGECRAVWGKGLFGMPASVAAAPHGNYVVTDIDRHHVTVHNADGTLLTQFGSWGTGDYQFNDPRYVAVDHNENIIISDSGNLCIKVFDKSGVFVRKFQLARGNQGQLCRPQGVAVDEDGNILVADRDNHRICAFNNSGVFLMNVLTKLDGIRHPSHITMDSAGMLAVVESHNGFLTKDPHHAVKLYKINVVF
ncbi:hypothetical protein NP493_66g05040 [Ridgeia piscesae]|uniref:Uncharacterized protein n=1 Tax=Ridgeia piscesae TaxID=27915 RepID=A0AAD9P9T6_RIDPI|nr:hypothetical protein NP493_66g05040 [Ridgeia piscesae]